MKAIVYKQYGSPDVLRVEDVEPPIPGDGQVLIKVTAAAVNPADWHLMRGAPFIARLSAGLFRPRHNRLGADVSGTVTAVGKSVTQFRIGDEVFGCLPLTELGSLAEYVCASESVIVAKPKNITHEQAAAAPLAALTALQGLRDRGQIQAGQKVLINGASGGVGTFAVQIAKSYGTEVTGVCSTANMDLVKSIGADHVVDYTAVDVSSIGQRYDLIFDAVGNLRLADHKRLLAPDGISSVAGFRSLKLLFQTMLFGGKRIGMMKTMEPNKRDLEMLRGLLESGKVKSVIDRNYPLEQAAEAMKYLELGHAKGKVVVAVV